MAGQDWTRDEVEATVADYFGTLERELRGEADSKAEHNRRLQERIGRSRGSTGPRVRRETVNCIDESR